MHTTSLFLDRLTHRTQIHIASHISLPDNGSSAFRTWVHIGYIRHPGSVTSRMAEQVFFRVSAAFGRHFDTRSSFRANNLCVYKSTKQRGASPSRRWLFPRALLAPNCARSFKTLYAPFLSRSDARMCRLALSLASGE